MLLAADTHLSLFLSRLGFLSLPLLTANSLRSSSMLSHCSGFPPLAGQVGRGGRWERYSGVNCYGALRVFPLFFFLRVDLEVASWSG